MATLMRSGKEKKLKETTPIPIVASDPLVCRNCGKKKWGYFVTYKTEIDLETDATEDRVQVDEELRCTHCKRKATLENNAALRALSAFHRVRLKEDGKS
jgi:hypothetical protein